MKKLIWTFMCFCAFSAGAQDLNKHKKLAWQKYENFKPFMKTGEILQDAGLSIIDPKDFTGNQLKIVPYDVWLQLYQQMYFGSTDESLRNPDSIKSAVTLKISHGLHPILYLKTPFIRIRQEAILNKSIDTTTLPWKITVGTDYNDLFETDTITIVATPQNGFGSKSNRYIIDSSFMVVRCNSNLLISNQRIDILLRNGSYTFPIKSLKLKEEDSEVGLSIQSIPSNQLPLPTITEGVQQIEVIPSLVYDELTKQIIPNFGKRDVKGLVTIFPGRDQTGKLHTSFEKVLIFTDGIDFGVYGVQNPEFDIENPDKTIFLNYGERGASMLMKGQSLEYNGTMATRWIPLSEYDAFENCPNMIETLRNEGYDFMFLDFKDGAGYIQDNAMVLSELLQSLNNKSGAFLTGKLPFGTSNISSIYLVGPSMGGQVVRYALNYMENHGEKHCVDMTGLFDSPNNGANIPMSVQYAMDELSFISFARDTRDRKLNSPAAKQLLIEHYSMNGATHPLRNDFISEINNLGQYPNITYIAAMSNGSGTGISQPIQPSTKMFYSQKLGAILNVEGYTNPGVSTNKGQLLFECTYLSLFRSQKFTSNQIPWESLSGGLFKGLDVNKYIKFNYDNFCFIPVTSALGDTTNNWNQTSITGFETPFNSIFFNQTKNDIHVKVDFSGKLNPNDPSFGNADYFRFRMHELDKKPDHLYANDHFNYGNKMFASLQSSIVEAGATLSFSNALVTPGWGISSIEMINRNGLDKYSPSDCKPTIYIQIKKGGTLEIGTPQGNSIIRNAVVRITAGSVVELDGILKIHPGSSLIIEEGAKLILNANNNIQLIDQSSILVIKGDLIINSKTFVTEGSGTLILDQPFQKSKNEFNGTTSIHLGKNANAQRTVFELGDHTIFKLSPAINLEIETATIVDLGTNALIETEGTLIAERVTFKGKNKATHLGVRLLNTAQGNIIGAKFLNGSPGLWIETSLFNQLAFKNLLFKDNVTGFVSINCSSTITSSSFIGNDVAYYFENNPANSTIAKCQFKNNHFSILGIQTLNSKFSITESNFDNGAVGVDITGGTSEIGCTRLANLNSAVKGTRQEISFLPGNVEFFNNTLDVEGKELFAWDLENTGTRFSNNGDVQIEFIQGTRSLIPDANGYFISGAGNLLNRDMYTNSTKSLLPRMYFFDQSFNINRPIFFANCGNGYSQCLIASKPGCWNNYNSEPLSASKTGNESANKSKSKLTTIQTMDSLLSSTYQTNSKIDMKDLLPEIYRNYTSLILQSEFTTEAEEKSYLEWIENIQDKYQTELITNSSTIAEKIEFHFQAIEFFLQIHEIEKVKSILSKLSVQFTDGISKSQLRFWECSLNETKNLCLLPINEPTTTNFFNPSKPLNNQSNETTQLVNGQTKTEVFSSTGQLVYSVSTAVDLQNQLPLPPGIYFVRTSTSKNTSFKKLIIQ